MSGTVLTSCHWLENNSSVSMLLQKCHCRKTLEMYTPCARKSERWIVSVCKIVLNFSLVLALFAKIGDNDFKTMDVLFNKGSLSNMTVFGRTISLTSGPDSGAGCSFIDPFLLALVCCSSGFVFWKLSRHACRILLQIQNFALPIAMNIALVPVALFLILCHANDFVFGDCDLLLVVQWQGVSLEDVWGILAAGALGWIAVIFLKLLPCERGLKFADKNT